MQRGLSKASSRGLDTISTTWLQPRLPAAGSAEKQGGEACIQGGGQRWMWLYLLGQGGTFGTVHTWVCALHGEELIKGQRLPESGS